MNVKKAIDKTHTEKAAKSAAKVAIMKSVHAASNAARKEAAEKGKNKKQQAEAAQKAAAAALNRGRGVQKVVKGVTKKAAEAPVVRVKVSTAKQHGRLSNAKVHAKTTVHTRPKAKKTA